MSAVVPLKHAQQIYTIEGGKLLGIHQLEAKSIVSGTVLNISPELRPSHSQVKPSTLQVLSTLTTLKGLPCKTTHRQLIPRVTICQKLTNSKNQHAGT